MLGFLFWRRPSRSISWMRSAFTSTRACCAIALRTDYHEANELFQWSMLPYLLGCGLLPILLLSRVRIVGAAWRRSLLTRAGPCCLPCWSPALR